MRKILPIAAAFVAAIIIAVILVVIRAERRANPIYALRVVHFKPGDENALLEITNLTDSVISFEYLAPRFTRRLGTIGPHGAQGTTVPTAGSNFTVTFWVHKTDENSWRVVCAPYWKRAGLELKVGARHTFEVAKPTGWNVP